MVTDSQPRSSEPPSTSGLRLRRTQKPGWLYALSEARTQILLCYIGLMVAFVGLSVPVIYRVLFQQIDYRLNDEVLEEINEFREDTAEEQFESVAELRQFMIDYIEDERAEKDLFFIGIVDRQIVDSNPKKLPDALRPNAQKMEWLHQLQQPETGHKTVADHSVGSVIYAIEPVQIQGATQGAFIVAYITADERREADAAFRIVLSVMFLILLVASLVAWIISGKVLRPLRLMASTARSISESDLTRRIQVQGDGEMAEVAKTFNDMLDRLQEAFTIQQNFINDASHELRTPITIIQGHLELMGDTPEERAEVMALVQDELDRMKRLVQDLLLLAKANRPDFLEPAWVDLDAFTEDLYNKARVLVNCNCILEQKAFGCVRLDRQRITQAVMNLVDNANQHTPSHGVIALGSELTDRSVRFWVRDTGKGIDPDDQARIFKRFARATKGHYRSEGTGLGLAIVQAIVTASGGKVQLESQPGHGSTFVLILPKSFP